MVQVQHHIREGRVSREELEQYKERYKVSNCIQKKDGPVLYVFEKEQQPEHSVLPEVTLDDVYLYYFEVL